MNYKVINLKDLTTEPLGIPSYENGRRSTAYSSYYTPHYSFEEARLYSPQKRTIEVINVEDRDLYAKNPNIKQYFLQFPEMLFCKLGNLKESAMFIGFHFDEVIYQMPFYQHNSDFSICLDDQNHFLFPTNVYSFDDLVKLFWSSQFYQIESWKMRKFQSYENWQKMNLDEIKEVITTSYSTNFVKLNEFLKKVIR